MVKRELISFPDEIKLNIKHTSKFGAETPKGRHVIMAFPGWSKSVMFAWQKYVIDLEEILNEQN